MPMITFAQNYEDVLLRRLFPTGSGGFYIDVGAGDPIRHSVTKHFYDRGWSGVNVEPVASTFATLSDGRPRDVNLNIALSDRGGTMTLHEPPASLGLATLSVPFAEGLNEHGYDYIRREVNVSTLAELCEQYAGGRSIDFLKIDVEGHEREVIVGGDWHRWRPRAVVVEATVTPELWEPMLIEAGYLLVAFDGLNRYYIRVEDVELAPRLAAPVNVFDDFITFDHWWQVEDLKRESRELRQRLEIVESELRGMSPGSMAAARRLNRVVRQIPGARHLARRWLGRAG
jgi:FkbM family methyltransferase